MTDIYPCGDGTLPFLYRSITKFKGERPLDLGIWNCKSGGEFFSYQYLPVKLPFGSIALEPRLEDFRILLSMLGANFVKDFNINTYHKSYIYLTAKRKYQSSDYGFNRPGWHSDGYGTNDINYIWSDSQPTIFNDSVFELSNDHESSMKQMEEQALPENNFTYENKAILRLNPRVIHKVGPIIEGVRTFVKVSFSTDRYDLEGNSHNYLLDYNWPMRPRNKIRNVPQSL